MEEEGRNEGTSCHEGKGNKRNRNEEMNKDYAGWVRWDK